MIPPLLFLALAGLAYGLVSARLQILYVRWFGPRGLATVVFAGVVVAQAVPAAQEIRDVALVTVALSIVAHGATAVLGARRYAAWFERESPERPRMPEAAEVSAPRGAA